jgi:putative restriction endonuclease
MTRYWWVNHKQTVRQEIEHQYLWSPKTLSNGRPNRFYDNMREASPGDRVLSYAGGVVRYIGRVAEFAFSAPKPEEFGTTGANWLNDGWLLPVFWTELDLPIRPKSMIDVLGALLPQKYSPIRPSTGDGNQGVYLAEISEVLLETVLAGSTIDRVLLDRGGANSLTFQVVKEVLDDRAEAFVRADLTLDDTTRTQIVQARRGQGKFRSNVEAVESACRVTGIKNPSLLIASHIRPWRSCENGFQRLHGMNGLLLTPDVDLLFDRGFITFEDDGRTRVSSRFDREDLQRLGLGDLAIVKPGFSDAGASWQDSGFRTEQRTYLKYHRAEVYVGD